MRRKCLPTWKERANVVVNTPEDWVLKIPFFPLGSQNFPFATKAKEAEWAQCVEWGGVVVSWWLLSFHRYENNASVYGCFSLDPAWVSECMCECVCVLWVWVEKVLYSYILLDLQSQTYIDLFLSVYVLSAKITTTDTERCVIKMACKQITKWRTHLTNSSIQLLYPRTNWTIKSLCFVSTHVSCYLYSAEPLIL